MSPPLKDVKLFRNVVWKHYRDQGRVFPWRQTRDPYRILVSEIMLQQTQADRVVPFFRTFVKKFPTVELLAQAPLASVIRLWSGLGYNRRALYLKRAGEIIVREYRGMIPKDASVLDTLPGVGPYTAAAVCAFAFNQPAVFIETNIRTVYIHHFFPRRKKVSDSVLLKLVKVTLDARRPAEWYQALMDYGAWIKKTVGNANVHSVHYAKQKPFVGSRRQLRGRILRQVAEGSMTSKQACRLYSREHISLKLVQSAISQMVREGLLRQANGRIFLPR